MQLRTSIYEMVDNQYVYVCVCLLLTRNERVKSRYLAVTL